MYRALTHDIEVTVTPSFLEDQSSPGHGDYFWAYTVQIANHGPRPVQLRARTWRIVDGDGAVEAVTGPGVVGEQPHIAPGDAYTYTSGCPLRTPHGVMSGSYAMIDAAGERFEVTIPTFVLDSPYAIRAGLARVIH
ncbi:Co2+/Mg2+ efflux protein ApaG [Camelimonas lactis]|uniref:Protein ApaG n=1 Tax=Camelimonas lactis TaxID=659006 RepID=A0A4R2GQ81_9HYPH|nr:Co2+/Mg2+ efflux protein ApaG [Camelimonas lactis]TCO11491.1 ApaG protein [Camelimonas lactis]